MTWAMEVSGHCEAEAYQGEKSGDGVDDEDSREAVSGILRQAKVCVGVGAAEEAVCEGAC